jgi:hypothetical protein
MKNGVGTPWLGLARVLPLALLAILGCPKEEEAPGPAPDVPFPFSISVMSDPGHPVAGARIQSKGKTIAVSDKVGLAKVEVVGAEGEAIALTIQCPDGFQSPDRPIVAGLRRLAQGSPPPKFETRCLPLVRTMVIGIRTENGANLPILYLGREVARTDPAGVAHFILQLKPNEQVALTLSTAEKGAEMLRPQNPTLAFVSKDQDDIVLLEQKFAVQKKIIYVRPAPKPMPL